MMNKQNQSRTTIMIVGLVFVVIVNTFLQAGLRLYNEWLAWSILAVALLLVAVALRFQDRLTTRATLALLLVPLAMAVLGALV